MATKETRISMGFHKTPLWKVFPYTIPRSSVAKIKGNLKMTALFFKKYQNYSTKFNNLGIIPFCERCFIQWCKIIKHLAHKVLKIRRSAFLGHPV